MCGGIPKTWASGRSGDRPLRFIRVAVLFIKTLGTARRPFPTIDSGNVMIYRGNTITKSFRRGRSPDRPAGCGRNVSEKNVRLSAVFKSALCAGAFQKHGPRDDLGIVPYVLLGWRFCLLRPSERCKGRFLWFFTVYRRRLAGGGYCANVRSGARKANLPGGGKQCAFCKFTQKSSCFFFFSML